MDTWVDTASLVRSARASSGLTQAEFGRLLKRPQSVISKYERGLVDPPGTVIIHCMNLLGPSPKDLSAHEVARIVEAKLAGPEFAAIRHVIVDLVNGVSA